MVYQGVMENVACEQSARMVAIKQQPIALVNYLKTTTHLQQAASSRDYSKFRRSLAVPLPFNIISLN